MIAEAPFMEEEAMAEEIKQMGGRQTKFIHSYLPRKEERSGSLPRECILLANPLFLLDPLYNVLIRSPGFWIWIFGTITKGDHHRNTKMPFF